MPARSGEPVLYVVACGGPPGGQLPVVVGFVQEQGWDVCVVATPDGAVRSQYKHPDEPDVLPPPDALVVAPATFNTVNKWAQGISDTLALGLLNEAVGLGLPVVAVPWVNAGLARHPVFARSLATLREWGVSVIVDPKGLPGASDEPPAFPWDLLQVELLELRRAVADRSRTGRS